jgi:hypothetical protein
MLSWSRARDAASGTHSARTASALFIEARSALQRVMWKNIMQYIQRDDVVAMLKTFRYAVHTAACTMQDSNALLHTRLDASAILVGLTGVFLKKKGRDMYVHSACI